MRIAANDRINEILTPDFLRAIAAGDVSEMNALAAKGVKVDPHASGLEIEDVQASSGEFTYRVRIPIEVNKDSGDVNNGSGRM